MENEGWAEVASSLEWHYFRNGESLCEDYNSYMNDLSSQPPSGEELCYVCYYTTYPDEWIKACSGQ